MFLFGFCKTGQRWLLTPEWEVTNSKILPLSPPLPQFPATWESLDLKSWAASVVCPQNHLQPLRSPPPIQHRLASHCPCRSSLGFRKKLPPGSGWWASSSHRHHHACQLHRCNCHTARSAAAPVTHDSWRFAGSLCIWLDGWICEPKITYRWSMFLEKKRSWPSRLHEIWVPVALSASSFFTVIPSVLFLSWP